MILDVFRFSLWLQKAKLPIEVRDTIEFFMEAEKRYDEERVLWDAQLVEIEKEKQAMIDEKGKQDTLIEQLRKAAAASSTPPVTKPNEEEMRIITSKFDGTCKDCGGMMPAGTKVRWSKAIGAKHLKGECR